MRTTTQRISISNLVNKFTEGYGATTRSFRRAPPPPPLASQNNRTSRCGPKIGIASSAYTENDRKIRYEDLFDFGIDDDANSNAAAMIGSMIHRKISRFFKDTGGNLTNGRHRRPRESVLGDEEEEEEDTPVETPETTEIVRRTMESFHHFWETKARSWDVDSVEKFVSFRLRNGILLTGIYDALFYDAELGGYVLADWKTAASRGEILTNLQQYINQLNLYRFIISVLRPEIRIKKMIIVLFTETDWTEYEVPLYVAETVSLLKRAENLECETPATKRPDHVRATSSSSASFSPSSRGGDGGRGGGGGGRRGESTRWGREVIEEENEEERSWRRRRTGNTIGERGFFIGDAKRRKTGSA